MALIDLVNRFDDISIDFFNGDLELLETVNALEDLSEECEASLDSRLEEVISQTEVPALAALLADITDFEESLLDASSLSIEDSIDEESDYINDYNDYYVDDESYKDYDEAPVYEENVEPLAPQAMILAVGAQEMPEEDVNFATDKDYDKMRQQWVDKRTSERKTSQKTEKETPLEERYKAAMTAFKELQGDDSQAWKLEDEAHWLVEDLDRWTSEALEWRDVFTKYYNKLAKEIQKRADKIADKYDTPITEEDINIEQQIDSSEEVSEEEIQDIEEDVEENTNETETQQESEQETVENQKEISEEDEGKSSESAQKEATVEEEETVTK